MACARIVAAAINKNDRKARNVATTDPRRETNVVRPMTNVRKARITATIYNANIQRLAVCILPKSSSIEIGIMTV